MAEAKRQYVRHGSELTYEELRHEAYTRVQESPKSQREVAEGIGRDRSTVAKAVTHEGSRYAKTQMAILNHLTGFEVEKKVRFRFERTD